MNGAILSFLRRGCIVRWMCAFVGALLILSAPAQTLRKMPLQYVPADSVVLWNQDMTNFIRIAALVDTALRPQSLPALPPKKAHKALKGAAFTLEKADALLPWTANARFGAVQEQQLYNHLLTSLQGSPETDRETAQTLLNHVGSLYLTTDSAVYVNQYMNSSVRLSLVSCKPSLDQVTGMPFSPRVKLRIGGIRNGTRFTLYLRVPDWQKTPLTVYINGRDEDLPVENGFLRIYRRWNRGDEVFFDLDFQEQKKTEAEWQVGPLIYTQVSADEAAAYAGEEVNKYGHVLLKVEGKIFQPLLDSPKEK